ncbi:MAG: hypothetical protein KAS16_01465 [Thermoplasmata archaeon]|nr:hypothetical protein [Thermoplasmata archaeon]
MGKKKNMPIMNENKVAIMKDENIPTEANETNKIAKIIFKIPIIIESLIKTYLAPLAATNILVNNPDIVQIATKSRTEIIHKGLSSKKIRSGAQNGKPNRKILPRMIESMIVTLKHELTMLLNLEGLDCGRYLIKPISKPRLAIRESNETVDITVMAKPI